MTSQPGLSTSALLVGIGGGSGSGKSALAHALVAALGPGRAALLAHDAYYRDGAARSGGARAMADYDVPEALDQALFLQHLGALRAGRSVRPPIYSFTIHRRVGDGVAVLPRPIVVVEGVFLLWDPTVRARLDLRIFLDAPERVRFERRLARDVGERGRTPEAVLTQLATTVREAHHTYVEPTRAMADLVLGTSGRLEPLAEIAAAVVLDRFARRGGDRARIAS
jgi:uridine kinase